MSVKLVSMGKNKTKAQILHGGRTKHIKKYNGRTWAAKDGSLYEINPNTKELRYIANKQ